VASFLLFVWQLYGRLPLLLIVLVTSLAVATAAFVRFCAKCGAMRARRPGRFGDTDKCLRCGSNEFRTLWAACLHSPPNAGAA